VSKISGMLTGTEPTEVAITTRRGGAIADWLGYRLMTMGVSIAPLTGLTAGAESDEPPQLPRIAAPTAAAKKAGTKANRQPSKHGN
jgi:hypothetical protein